MGLLETFDFIALRVLPVRPVDTVVAKTSRVKEENPFRTVERLNDNAACSRYAITTHARARAYRQYPHPAVISTSRGFSSRLSRKTVRRPPRHFRIARPPATVCDRRRVARIITISRRTCYNIHTRVIRVARTAVDLKHDCYVIRSRRAPPVHAESARYIVARGIRARVFVVKTRGGGGGGGDDRLRVRDGKIFITREGRWLKRL